MRADPDLRTPIILLDRSGYGWYQDPGGARLVRADRYAVRLLNKVIAHHRPAPAPAGTRCTS